MLKQLGARIRRRHKELGLTQSSLAGHSLTKSSVSQIEQGRVWPSLPTLLYLARRLELRGADLLLTTAEEAARLGAWEDLLAVVTSPDLPPGANARCLTAIARLALVEGLPRPDDAIWQKLADQLAESGERQLAGTMLAAYGRALKQRNDRRVADILLRAAELLTEDSPAGRGETPRSGRSSPNRS